MRIILFPLIMLLALSAQSQDMIIADETPGQVKNENRYSNPLPNKKYCIQVMSTRNPHLITRDMVNMVRGAVPMVEPGPDGYFRILIVYPTLEEAEAALYSWQRGHARAFIVVRTTSAVEKLNPLFQ